MTITASETNKTIKKIEFFEQTHEPLYKVTKEEEEGKIRTIIGFYIHFSNQGKRLQVNNNNQCLIFISTT